MKGKTKPKKKRTYLRRPCSKCGEMFMPTSKEERVCGKCLKKNMEKRRKKK